MDSATDIELVITRKMENIKEDILKKHGIIVKTYITKGRTDSEIVDFAKTRKMQLIVMGTHGASGYKEVVVGSNADRIVSLSEVPVLTMQTNTDKLKLKNILLPIDNSMHSEEKVNMAMEFASMFGAKIYVLALPHTTDEPELGKFKTKLHSVEQILQLVEIPFYTTWTEGDNLAQAAMEYSHKNLCDLIVINTGHESKIAGFFLGVFAQQIVNHSKIPVLSVKHITNSL